MAGEEPETSDVGVGTQRSATPWLVAGAAFVVTVIAGAFLFPRSSAQPAAAAPAQAAAAPAQAGEKIAIPSLGLSIVRPADWVTVSAEENARNLRSVQMDDPEFQALAQRYANVPIVAMAKFKEPYADLNPSLKINVRPLGGLAGRNPEEILSIALPMFERGFADLKVQSGPSRTRLAGRPAGYVRMAYTLRAGDGAFPTVSEIWLVQSGPVYFMIGSGTRADEKNGSRAEIRSILDTLVIE